MNKLTKDDILEKYGRTRLAIDELISDSTKYVSKLVEFSKKDRSKKRYVTDNPIETRKSESCRHFPSLNRIFSHKTFLRDVLEAGLISSAELSYIFTNAQCFKISDISNLAKNLPLLTYILKNNLVSYQHFSQMFYWHEMHKYEMFKDKTFLNDVLFEKCRTNQWSVYDLIDFGISDSTDKRLREVYLHTAYYSELFERFEDKIDFLKVIELFKERNAFSDFLSKSYILHEIFEKEENLSTTLTYIRNVLRNIDTFSELHGFVVNFDNGFFLTTTLKNFLVSEDDLKKFNGIIRSQILDKYFWYEKRFLNVFDLVDEKNPIIFFQFIENEFSDPRMIKVQAVDKEVAEQIVELSKICSCLYLKCNDRQRKDLSDIVQTSDRARNLLMQIVENNLQHQYDFDQLKDLITKDDRKKRQKLNF